MLCIAMRPNNIENACFIGFTGELTRVCIRLMHRPVC